MQTLSLLDSTDAEEIIKLRVDLAKLKAKLHKYQQLLPKIDKVQAHLASLFQLFNHRQTFFTQLSTLLQLQVQPQKLPWRDLVAKNKWDNGEYLQELTFRGQQIVKAWDQETNVLSCLSKAVEDILNQNKGLKDSYHELEKEHGSCSGKMASLHKQLEVMRLMEVELKQKQTIISELKRSRKEAEEQMEEKDQRIEVQEAKIRELSEEMEEKNKQIVAFQERGNENEMAMAEKEQMVDRCNQLIESLEMGEEEYLTHYFRTNGLPLDVKKPTKNKYQMVFEE